MPMEFQNLRVELLRYKNADAAARLAILDATINKINNLPATVNHKNQAVQAYNTMAAAATVINYADALRRIENQEFFDILIDFKMPAIFEQAKFALLNDYFEFHIAAPQMRLKKPITEIPLFAWELFKEAQKAQLAAKGTSDKFNLDELDILNPPRDQLYPLPIQMMGKYENEAVDRICANQRGEYRFVKRFGVHLLPGGGMVEIDLEKSQDKLMHKMLEEHLEEEHGNLWHKAADRYNELASDAFIAAIRTCIEKSTKIEDVLENTTLRGQLNDALATGKTNAEVIADVIRLIDAIELSSDANKSAEQTKLIQALRATVQVETFKLTALYQQAFDHIKANTIVKKIEQFGDTRACGGKQVSNSFLMTGEPLEVWFGRHFNGVEGELGDDLSGGSIERLTLLQTLAKFSSVKFSHVLIALANQLECFNRNTLDFNNVWDHEQYNAARAALVVGASNTVALEKIATKRHLDREAMAYKTALRQLTKLAATGVSDKMKPHLNKLLREVNDLKASGEEQTAELTKALTQTQALLDGSLPPLTYQATAKTMQGKPSHGLKVIGGIMLAIGAIAMAVGLAGIAVPIATAVAATLSLTSAVCFFSSSQQGLSAAMNRLAIDNRSIAAPSA